MRLVEHEKDKDEFKLVEFCQRDCSLKSKSGKRVFDVKENVIQIQSDGLFDFTIVINEQSAHSTLYNGGAGKGFFVWN